MTTLHDLTGVQGRFSCSHRPEEITDQARLEDAQFYATEEISHIISPYILLCLTRDERRDLSKSISERIFLAVLKSLSAEEFISLKKEIK